jgi:hypothetical protein
MIETGKKLCVNKAEVNEARVLRLRAGVVGEGAWFI